MAEQETIAVPRPSATVLILRDDPLEVLMVRRHAAQTFASALVFPGGKVDPEDHDDAWLDLIEGGAGLSVEQRGFRIAALRETYEETSILIARHAAGHCVAPLGAVGDKSFIEVVRESGGKLMLDEMVPFGHWITPVTAAKRFDVHFFVCRAPDGQQAVCDGSEAVALEWIRPQDGLDRARGGDRLPFATQMNLLRLTESPDAASAIEAARHRPIVTVLPVVERLEKGIIARIPAEAGYGETEHYNPRGATR